jgi:hypothetical protein
VRTGGARREVFARGAARDSSERIGLTAARRHALRIEYVNPSGRAELKLFRAATTRDPAKFPLEWLHRGTQDDIPARRPRSCAINTPLTKR